MNAMINFAMRMLGLGKVVDALDGETSKTCIAAVGKILAGGISVMTGSAHVTALILAAHGGAEYFQIGKQLYHGDADTAMIAGGILAIMGGYADIGNRHATAKLANALDAQASGPSTAPPAAPAAATTPA